MSSLGEILSPDQRLLGVDNVTVGDFWAWGYSDILSNANRAVFAEFIVGLALDVVHEPRTEWDAADLRYRGFLIEVKASAYLQSWPQETPSVIRFDISKKKSWHADTNTNDSDRVRSAHCYVFCIYAEKDSAKCNIVDITAWRFYVISTERIDSAFGDQKSVGLGRIEQLTQPIEYSQLRGHIDRVSGVGVAM